VFVDESGANVAMGRSHAWVRKGQVVVEARPMNWGDNLTLIGAMRNADRFVLWVARRLAPKLRAGDVVVLDNLRAHKDARVMQLIEHRGASVKFLPPYSYDLNPIESAWALMKKRIRAVAPRTARALRRTVSGAWRCIRPTHCQRWLAHAGYY
jgi:transposase